MATRPQPFARLYLSLAVALPITSAASSYEALRGRVYWVDSSAIWCADMSTGDDRTAVVTGLAEPSGLALDLTAGRLYWTEASLRRIRSAYLDGSDVNLILSDTSGIYDFGALTIDRPRGHMYWLVMLGASIAKSLRRANLDGTGIVDLVQFANSEAANSVAVDPSSGWIYWSDTNAAATKQRISRWKDGQQEILIEISRTGALPAAVAVDHVAQNIYWSDQFHNDIRRTTVGQWGTHVLPVAAPHVTSITVDHLGGKVYWGDEEDKKIKRANLDGSDAEVVVNAGISSVSAIAIHPLVTTTTTTTSSATTATTTTTTSATTTTHTTVTSTTATTTTTTTTTCFDTNGHATDKSADGCNWYANNMHICGLSDDKDFFARTMCCACGGGTLKLGQTRPPTPAPTAPTLAPTPQPTIPPTLRPSPAPTPTPPAVSHDPVAFSLIVQNVIFSKVEADSVLRGRFEKAAQDVIAEQAGSEIPADHVTVTLSEGSVRVDASVLAAGYDTDAPNKLKVKLQQSWEFGDLTRALRQRLNTLPGIENARSGSMSVQMDTAPHVVIGAASPLASGVTPPTRRRRQLAGDQQDGNWAGSRPDDSHSNDGIIILVVVLCVIAVCLGTLALYLLLRLRKQPRGQPIHGTGDRRMIETIGSPIDAWDHTPGVVHGLPVNVRPANDGNVIQMKE